MPMGATVGMILLIPAIFAFAVDAHYAKKAGESLIFQISTLQNNK